MQEIGETRNEMGRDLVAKVEKIVEARKDEKKPYYIVFHAKQDKFNSKLIKATLKLARIVPAGLLSVLVWYVDNAKGVFEFKPNLSSPPDIPVPESLLSTEDCDFIPRIAEQGKILQVVN